LWCAQVVVLFCATFSYETRCFTTHDRLRTTIKGKLKQTPFLQPEAIWNESANGDYPLALQAEGGSQDAALSWSTLGWGYWGRQSNPGDAPGYHWTYDTVPLVDRFKYVTSGQYLTNICERYAKNKTNDLQLSWFNGAGYESWGKSQEREREKERDRLRYPLIGALPLPFP
jgi:hypothetical protein